MEVHLTLVPLEKVRKIRNKTVLNYVYFVDDIEDVFMCDREVPCFNKFEKFLEKAGKWLYKNNYYWRDLLEGNWDYCPLDAPDEVQMEEWLGEMEPEEITKWIEKQKERGWTFKRRYSINSVNVMVLDVPDKLF